MEMIIAIILSLRKGGGVALMISCQYNLHKEVVSSCAKHWFSLRN